MKRSFRRLSCEYKKRKPEIEKRLKSFRTIRGKSDEEMFSELIFCLFTPQAKATACASAVTDLMRSGLLMKGCVRAIRPRLRGRVRFHNKKAEYLVTARKRLLEDKRLSVRDKVRGDSLKAREWLVENIKGLGYKEASHFLRNIGLGEDLAILDVHILRNLKKYGVIRDLPANLNKKRYLEIEDKMRSFAAKVRIPLSHLDLLFWSLETGHIFK